MEPDGCVILGIAAFLALIIAWLIYASPDCGKYTCPPETKAVLDARAFQCICGAVPPKEK